MKPNDFSQFTALDDVVAKASATVASSRSTLREERHPNAVTAPPVNRGSMVPRPWRGFWNSLGTAALVKLGAGKAEQATDAKPLAAEQPWQRAAKQRRLAFMMLT
ncbi:MAG: glucans biosynthesis glucosyltransferase MdoH, partial [Variovorax sp.]